MKFRLKVAATVWKQLRDYHLSPENRLENLSYLWGRAVVTPEAVTILVPHTTRPILFDPDCFDIQAGYNVRLRTDVLNGMMVHFAGAGEFNVLINVHPHWFDKYTCFSGVDDQDDLSFDRYLRTRFEPMLAAHPEIGVARPIFNVSLVLAQKGCDARLTDVRRKPVFQQLDEIQVLGEHFLNYQVRGTARASVSDVHARQRDFISATQQAHLAGLEVLLVGAGGLGSIMGESLGRLGVGALTIVDDDRLDRSNLNRWQGALPEEVGQPKVELLARRLRTMFPAMKVRAFNRSIFAPDLEHLFAEVDAIIGGLDNDPARYFLNAASLQYLLPYFDGGVSVTAGSETDFLSRFYAVLPGTSGCVECGSFQVVDWEEINDAYMNATTRRMKRAAGYVMDRPDVSAPSVYALNQRSVSTLIAEFMNYFCAWRPTATSILESWRHSRFQRADRDNFPEGPARDCPTCGFRAGVGDSEILPRPSAHDGASALNFPSTL